MKSLARRCCSEEGLLLQVTLLLSLAGLRLDLDLYLRRTPETLHAGWAPPGAARVAGSSPPHPKCPDRDWDRLLREVRALGTPYIPSTLVEAWLVHAVAAGEGNGALPSSPVSGAGGGGPSESSAQEGPSYPFSSRGSSLQAERGGEVSAAPEAESTPGGSDCSSLEDTDLKTGLEVLDYCFPYKETEQSESQEEKIKQVNDEENEKKAETEGEETENIDSSTEGIIENTSSTSLTTAGLAHDNTVEDIWQDFLLSPELQENSSSSHYSVNLTHAISHDVSLHEAMLLRSNHSSWANPEIRNVRQQESFLQLNSSNTNPEALLNGTNLGLFPSVDIRNLTNQDILSDLDENIFEINLMALALEGGFDPMEVSQLFEEPDSDSGLSLNSGRNRASSNNSNSSSVSTCDEGAVGYSSDTEYTSHDDLGAVGGHYPEHSKHCQLGYQSYSNCCGETPLQHILHNHTYNHLPNELASTSEHYPSSSEKSERVKGRCLNSTNKYLSHDELHVKFLRIPFSVDEIVCAPVEAFNNMLSKFYLSDTQISLMRDIRRRGKNKVAAQNCRKRKLDVILNLEDDVCNLQAQKERLKKQKSQCSKSISHMKQKLNDLYHVIFSRLRDDQGRPVNPSHFALHCNNNGCILIIPKRLVTSEQKQDNQKGQKQKY